MASLLHRQFSALRLTTSAPITSFRRTFTTTSPLLALSTKQYLAKKHESLPPYPYGPNQWYKQSNHGLYGGSSIQFGNNVSPRTKTKTRRSWAPNIKSKKLYSVGLRRHLRVRVSTRVLRTIDKVGGLDEYLLGEKPARVKELGMEGWRLRALLMQTKDVRERYREQALQLGLPVELIAERWGEGENDKLVKRAEHERLVAAKEERRRKEEEKKAVKEAAKGVESATSASAPEVSI